MQKIDIEVIRTAITRLLDRLDSVYGGEIDLAALTIPVAEYWEFDLETAFACSPSPEMQAGDFGSDLEEVQEILERPQDQIVLWHDLDHVGSVLRGLAFIDLRKQIGNG